MTTLKRMTSEGRRLTPGNRSGILPRASRVVAAIGIGSGGFMVLARMLPDVFVAALGLGRFVSQSPILVVMVALFAIGHAVPLMDYRSSSSTEGSRVLAKDHEEGVPEQVLDVLKTSSIGYMSVASPKGELFSYPVAFYFSRYKLYFVTPISAAKLRFIRANPNISFLVDNHVLTKGACGVMIQGRARVFSVANTILSIVSVGPNLARFSKKYPGMFSFYFKGKDLPDERKLYKYRLIRLDPKKMLYWVGYEFGKFLPGDASPEDPLADMADEKKLDTLAKLMASADEDMPLGKVSRCGKKIPPASPNPRRASHRERAPMALKGPEAIARESPTVAPLGGVGTELRDDFRREGRA